MIKRNTKHQELHRLPSPLQSLHSTPVFTPHACVRGDQVTCPSSTMGTAMTSHWLPALAGYPGMPGEGTWVSLGAVTKLPSILGDAAVWKTEGVGPNSPSDCGFGVTVGRSCHRSCGHLRFSATGAPTEPPSRVVSQMRGMARELQCGSHVTIGGSCYPTRLKWGWAQGG